MLEFTVLIRAQNLGNLPPPPQKKKKSEKL